MQYNLTLDYKIIDFRPDAGQIIIFCEGYGNLAIDLPIDNGKYPEHEDLDIYIRGFIPKDLIERSSKIKKGIKNSDYISSLVVRDVIQEPTEEQIKSDLIFDIRLERNSLLYKTDWTQLPNNGLSDAEKNKWKEYRQVLRDITKQENLENIQWPKMPNEIITPW